MDSKVSDFTRARELDELTDRSEDMLEYLFLGRFEEREHSNDEREEGLQFTFQISYEAQKNQN